MAAPWCGLSMFLQQLVLLLVAGIVAPGWGLYFHLGETERKCFIEEIPDETMVIGAQGKWGGRRGLTETRVERARAAGCGLGYGAVNWGG